LKKYTDRVKEGLSMYGGVPVPDGYSPMTYDEVLEINQKLKEIILKSFILKMIIYD